MLDPCLSPVSTDPEIESPIEVLCYPNPFRESTNITFSCGNERVRLSIFDTLGHEVRVIMDKGLSAGEHTVQINGRSLAPGYYFFRLQIGYQQKTKRIVKL